MTCFFISHSMCLSCDFSSRAKLLQSRQTLCDLMDCGPPGSSVHGILQARNKEVGFHALLQEIFLTQGLKLLLLYTLH